MDRVFQSTTLKDIEIFRFSELEDSVNKTPASGAELKRQKIVKRPAQEFKDGSFANLGIVSQLWHQTTYLSQSTSLYSPKTVF